MKLKNGMLVKFKNCIEPDENEFNKKHEDEYFKMLDEIQGKIVTIRNTDIRYGTGETTFEVYENEFVGHIFPISYLECIIPTIPIDIPKRHLTDNCIVQLRNGTKLLYTNSTFFKNHEPCMKLNQFNEELIPRGTSLGLSNLNDIMKIYKDYKCEEVIWERK